MKITQKAKKEFLKSKLGTNRIWAEKALLTVFEKQTEDEKNSDSTRHHNSVGFSGLDAEILSSFAKQVQHGKYLSPKQTDLLLKKMPKYWSQILQNSDEQKLIALMQKNSQFSLEI